MVVDLVCFSEQANAQVENLQRQLLALAEQRDAAVLQLASAQDTANQYAASLNNLQMVLEQFQQGKFNLNSQVCHVSFTQIPHWPYHAIAIGL